MTGLILVHGIGRQKPGDTFSAFLDGVRKICPAVKEEGIATNAWRVTANNRPFMVYEAYWADLLNGDDVRGTFNVEDLFELVWYPLINYRLRPAFRQTYSQGRIRLWTWMLVCVVPFVYLGHDWGWRFLLALIGLIDRWERLSDDVPADVINFVNSAGGAYLQAPQSEPKTAYRGRDEVEIHVNKLAPKAGQIMDRFLEVLDQSTQRDGCSEIHVLAHSLGTVVAHQALASASSDGRPSDILPAQITRLYTIGCPLQKVRFFWPKLFEKRVEPTLWRNGRCVAEIERDLQWSNFWNRVDAVSGKLSSFPGLPEPNNLPATGLGGFFTAHVRYFGNPEFLTQVLKEATPGFEAVRVAPTSLFTRAISVLQDLLAPIAFIAFACLGIAGAGSALWGAAWLWAKLLDGIGHVTGLTFLIGNFWWMKWLFWASFTCALFFSFAANGKNRALTSHQECWGPPDYRSAKASRAGRAGAGS